MELSFFSKHAKGKIENFADRPGEHRKFGDGARRECEILVAQLLGGFEDVHRVIGNALKIADGLQKCGGLLALRSTHRFSAELYEVRAENVLVVVAQLLVLPDPLGESGEQLSIAVRESFSARTACSAMSAATARLRESASDGVASRRSSSSTRCSFSPLSGTIRMASFFQAVPGGQEHGGAEKVEGRMGNGDAGAGRGLVEQRRASAVRDYGEHRKQDDDADNVEHQMHHGGAARAFLFVPMEERSAVTVVPMFWPMMMGIAAA